MGSPEQQHRHNAEFENTAVAEKPPQQRTLKDVSAQQMSEQEFGLRKQLKLAERNIERYREKLKTMDATHEDHGAYDQIVKNLETVRDRFQRDLDALPANDSPKHQDTLARLDAQEPTAITGVGTPAEFGNAANDVDDEPPITGFRQDADEREAALAEIVDQKIDGRGITDDTKIERVAAPREKTTVDRGVTRVLNTNEGGYRDDSAVAEVEEHTENAPREVLVTTLNTAIRDIGNLHFDYNSDDHDSQLTAALEILSAISPEALAQGVADRDPQIMERLMPLRARVGDVKTYIGRFEDAEKARENKPGVERGMVIDFAQHQMLDNLIAVLEQASEETYSDFLPGATPRREETKNERVPSPAANGAAQTEQQAAAPDIVLSIGEIESFEARDLVEKIAYLQQAESGDPAVFRRLVQELSFPRHLNRFTREYNALSDEDKKYVLYHLESQKKVLEALPEQDGITVNGIRKIDRLLDAAGQTLESLIPEPVEQPEEELAANNELSERAQRFVADPDNAAHIYSDNEAIEEAARLQEEKREAIAARKEEQEEREWIYNEHRAAKERRAEREKQEVDERRTGTKKQVVEGVHSALEEQQREHSVTEANKERIFTRYTQVQDTLTAAIAALHTYNSGYTVTGSGELLANDGLGQAMKRKLTALHPGFRHARHQLEGALQQVAELESKIVRVGGSKLLTEARNTYGTKEAAKLQQEEEANKRQETSVDEPEAIEDFSNIPESVLEDAFAKIDANLGGMFIEGRERGTYKYEVKNGKSATLDQYLEWIDDNREAGQTDNDIAFKKELFKRWWERRTGELTSSPPEPAPEKKVTPTGTTIGRPESPNTDGSPSGEQMIAAAEHSPETLAFIEAQKQYIDGLQRKLDEATKKHPKGKKSKMIQDRQKEIKLLKLKLKRMSEFREGTKEYEAAKKDMMWMPGKEIPPPGHETTETIFANLTDDEFRDLDESRLPPAQVTHYVNELLKRKDRLAKHVEDMAAADEALKPAGNE